MVGPTLYSKRLVLTPSAPADVDITIEMFTDPEVLQHAGGPMTEDEIRRGMSNWVKRGGDGCIGIWCISNRDSGEKLGTVALLPMPVDRDDTDYSLVVAGEMPDADIEIGYFLKRSAWGHGYATEAASRVLQYAFEESPLTEVVATFEPRNAASRRVLEKLGFTNHGTRRCYAVEGPDYRLNQDDWNKAK